MNRLRFYRRLGVAQKAIGTSFAALLLVAIVASGALYYRNASAQAGTSNFHAAPHGHVVQFPTRQDAAQARASSKPQVLGSGDLVYGGGHVLRNPVSYVIFWGAAWGNGGANAADAQVILNYFNDVGTTNFEHLLTQYSDTTGAIANTHTLGGTFFDSSAPPTDTTCNAKPTIQNQSILDEIGHALSVKGWPTDTTNATYYVYTPSGDYVNAGGACSDLPGSFCAYHSAAINNLNQIIAYAALPYPISMNVCGVTNFPNGRPVGDSEVNFTSHEQFEAITDPLPCGTPTECSAAGFPGQGGWIDTSDFEIGDKCAWIFPSTNNGTTPLNNGGTFEMQLEYSNATSSCVNGLGSHLLTAEGSVASVTAPSTNAPARTLTIRNQGADPSNWSVSGLPSFVASVVPSSGNITPFASQQVTVNFNTSGFASPQTLTGSFQIGDANADNAPVGVPVTVVLANISKQWYFAEGHTGDNFAEYLTLENPGSGVANVTVTYLLGLDQQGHTQPPLTKVYAVPANSRQTVVVNQEVGTATTGIAQDVSMVLSSDQPIVAERPMYFTYNGLQAQAGLIPGGTDVVGATGLGSSFDFGYLDTTAKHATYLTILNQNTFDVDATVQFFPAAGGSPILYTKTVAAKTRGTILANTVPGLAAGSYSALVHLVQTAAPTTPAPGLVERPLYLVDALTNQTGAGDTVGVATPLTTWYFAEGYTASNFSERYIVSNPSTSVSANVKVTYLKSDGTTVADTTTLGPGAQHVFLASSKLADGTPNSAVVTADQPFLAERFISFHYTGPVGNVGASSIPGATDVLGAAAPGHLFEFAEGYSGGQFGEWLTLENPGTQLAHVQVTYLPDNGSAPTVVTYPVGPNSRATVYTNAVMPNQSFSMQVVSDQLIVAERPMYFVYTGIGLNQPGGSDVIGYQP